MIETNPDWIAIKRFDYSLSKLEDFYADRPDGCPGKVVAAGLQMTELEIDERYKAIIQKLRGLMKIED